MECLNTAVTSTIPLVANAVAEHVAYPFKVGDNIRALELATRELVALKEDVMTSIRNAERGQDVRTKTAEEWLAQVEAIEKEAEQITANYREEEEEVEEEEEKRLRMWEEDKDDNKTPAAAAIAGAAKEKEKEKVKEMEAVLAQVFDTVSAVKRAYR